MFYLQKVIALVESEKCMKELECLSDKLGADGISFQCFLRKDMIDCPMAAQGEIASKNEQGDAENRLWLVDCAERAVSLRTQGEVVLVVLHEDNKNQDFSGILYACEEPGELDAEYMDRIYRRYKGLPWDIAETTRCIIRETTEEDVEAFFEIYANPEIIKYTEGLHSTVEQEKQYVRDYIEKVYGFYGFGIWTILKKESGEIIGRAGFAYRAGYEEPEMGFVIGVPWQRQGYAWEVCSALMELAEAELYLESIQAFVMPENIASKRLCEKLGLHKIENVQINNTIFERYFTRR